MNYCCYLRRGPCMQIYIFYTGVTLCKPCFTEFWNCPRTVSKVAIPYWSNFTFDLAQASGTQYEFDVSGSRSRIALIKTLLPFLLQWNGGWGWWIPDADTCADRVHCAVTQVGAESFVLSSWNLYYTEETASPTMWWVERQSMERSFWVSGVPLICRRMKTSSWSTTTTGKSKYQEFHGTCMVFGVRSNVPETVLTFLASHFIWVRIPNS